MTSIIISVNHEWRQPVSGSYFPLVEHKEIEDVERIMQLLISPHVSARGGSEHLVGLKTLIAWGAAAPVIRLRMGEYAYHKSCHLSCWFIRCKKTCSYVEEYRFCSFFRFLNEALQVYDMRTFLSKDVIIEMMRWGGEEWMNEWMSCGWLNRTFHWCNTKKSRTFRALWRPMYVVNSLQAIYYYWCQLYITEAVSYTNLTLPTILLV